LNNFIFFNRCYKNRRWNCNKCRIPIY